MTGVDVDVPLCAAWKTEGVTVAGREDGGAGDSADELNKPVGLYAARDGTLYVADTENHRIMKYAPNGGRNGTQIGDGKGSGPRHLNSPNAVAVDEDMNTVYINDKQNQRIQLWREGGTDACVETVMVRVDQNSSSIDTSFRAEDIQLDPQSKDRSLYILEQHKQRVTRRRISAAIDDISFRVHQDSTGIHVDTQQNLYVVSCRYNEIRKWPRGQSVAGTGQPEVALDLINCPTAVVVDNDGRMFIADTKNHRILLWYYRSREGICIAGCSGTRKNITHKLAAPNDLSFDWHGNLLVADTGNNRIQRFDLFTDEKCGKYHRQTVLLKKRILLHL